MIRIAALNDSSSEEDSRAPKTPTRTTKEAKESEAFTLYDAALRLQRQGEEDLAEAAFKDLLNHVFLRETAQLVEDEEEGADQDGLRLLYSIHKNLASMALQRGDLQSAIWSYVEAVKIDTTEVTVWYKIGTIALKLYNFPLARLGFEKGLHCNPNHWPCLDHVVTLLYAMNDYWNCLYYISRALEKDSEYTKGLVLRKQILKEHPSLKYDTEEMFEQCDKAIFTARVEPSESQEYINEALDLRDRRRELAKEPEPLPIKLPKAINHFTWKNLGESLVELYDRAVNSDPPVSLGLCVDISEYRNCTDESYIAPAKSPVVEETADNSGDMEVDPVPVDTEEMQSTEEQKKNGISTVKLQDDLMVTEDSAAVESQIDKDDVAMDTDDVQDQINTNSSLVSSNSVVVSPSSPVPMLFPVSTDTVSHGKDVSMTDSPKTSTEVRQTSTEVRETPADVRQTPADVRQNPADVRQTPADVRQTPADVRQTPADVSQTPADVRQTPADVRQTSTEVRETPADVRQTPADVRQTPADVRQTPADVSQTPADVRQTPADVRQTPADVRQTPADVRQTPADVRQTPADVRQTPADVPELTKTTASISLPLITISDLSQTTGTGPPVAASSDLPELPIEENHSQNKDQQSSTDSVPVIQKSSCSSQQQETIVLPEILSKTAPLQHMSNISGSPKTTALLDLPSLSGVPVLSPRLSVTPRPLDKVIESEMVQQPSVVGMSPTKPVAEISQGTTVSGMLQTLGVPAIPPTTTISEKPVSTSSNTPPSQPTSGTSSIPASEKSFSGVPSATSTELSQTTLIKHTSTDTVQTSPGIPLSVSETPLPIQASVSPQSMAEPEIPQTSPLSQLGQVTEPSHTTSSSGMLYTTTSSESLHTTLLSSMPPTTPPAGMPQTSLERLLHTPPTGMPPSVLPPTTPTSGLPPATPSPVSSHPSTLSTPVSGIHHTSPVTALHDHTCAASIETEDLAKGRGKTAKRKRAFIPEDFGLSVKRRSARVRNVSKPKEEPSVNFEELLISFLPSSLKQLNEDEDTEMLVMQEQERCSEEKITGGESDVIPEVQKLAKTEDMEVREFLKQNIKNAGTICLMLRYLFALAKRGETKWPAGLTEVFLKVYSRTRKHFNMPDIFSLGECEEYTQNLGKTCQLAAEFQLDQWIVNNRMTLSPGSSPRSPGAQQLQTSDLPPHCNDDLWFITGLTGCGEVMGSNWLPHCIRVYWMKARFYMLQGKMEDALYCFQKTLDYLEYAEKEGESTKICLVNCKMDRFISIDQVKSHQESLHRCQSLEETQKLYESGNYEKVVDFILQTFTQPQLKGKTLAFSTAIPERQSQLLLLQDSLYKMDAHKKGMVWGEVSFNEAVQCYRKATTTEQKEAWSGTLTQICENLIRILDRKDDVLKDVPSINLVRLSRNLINIIDITMAAPDSAVEMPIGTVLPWILLYKLIKFEENKLRSMQVSTPEAGQTDLLDGMPSYLMLLNIAHEYLARHSWCTKSNGSLLIFYLDVAQEFLTGSCQFKRDLEQSYEQCVYCLFGHPNKKGRARHLMDHNASQIDLTWDSAQKIFEYFKPNSVPEFDSYKADAVSADMEFLLKRIAQLVPESEKPAKLMENLQEYIEGNTNIPPNPETKHLSTVSKELYYLLADYYFKNKEQTKAVRFYMSDICMNPMRLDSWAGMGLARMSQLEQKLSSVETEDSKTALKMDMPIYRKSIGALRCFRRAVEIDDSNAKLWMEYGSLAYQLHSHASRQLKWKNWFPLTQELEQIASDSRQEMLQTAYNCYKKASECESEENEEEWLQHYMMAKCLEKMRKPPKEYLDNYKKAANYLYEENATFPKKIVYAYTTPHLAVESLEMFYRIHVSIMKILLRNKTVLESDLQLFQQYINEAANSPFAQCQEKRQESVTTVDGTLLPVPQGTKTGGRRSKVMPMDHTYSKQKSMVEGSGTDSATSDLEQVTTSKPVSMVTHREVKVIDSSEAAAGSMMELSAENLDEHSTVKESVEKEKEDADSKIFVEKSEITGEQGQGDMAVDEVSEGEGFFLDEVTGIVKQTSLGFDVKGDTHALDRGDSVDVEIGTKVKSADKVMEVSSQEKPSNVTAMEVSSQEKLSHVTGMEVSSQEKASNETAMDVSCQEDKLLSEDKDDGKKMDHDGDSSVSEFDVEALLSEYLPTDGGGKTSGDDKKSGDKGQTTDTKVKSGDSKEGNFDGQEDEKSFHSDVRELSQGNESMESETRQYGDMNIPEDQESGTPIDPSELSLSKGLRERMAQELEGDLVSKYEPDQSGMGTAPDRSGQGTETESNARKEEKSVSSVSDNDDDLGDSLDDSFLSDSSDSIPDSLGSPSKSAADSLSKSGDSLSKSGGFLAQFNQFLSKKIIPDDIISESSPEKSLSSPLKASRSQSPSSQVFTSDADTGLKVSSQQDTVSSVGVKEDLTSISSNLSPKYSTHSDSANQKQDNNDSKEKTTETLLPNQNQDNKNESLSICEKSEDVHQPMKSGTESQQDTNAIEINMDVSDNKDKDGREKDGNETTLRKDNDKVENSSENLNENINNKVEGTTSQEGRVDSDNMDVPEIVPTTINLKQSVDTEKMEISEVESTTTKEQKVEDENKDVTSTDSTICQEHKSDNVAMDVNKAESTPSKEENVNKDVSDIVPTGGTGQRLEDEKMDVDDKDKDQTPRSGSPKSGAKEDVMSVRKPDGKGASEEMGGSKYSADNVKESPIGKEKSDSVKIVPTDVEKKRVKKDKKGTESPKRKGVSGKAGSSKLHKQLIEQCMAALCLCLSRFPTHYKSLYRLAYTYIYSPYHKNLQYAHDLLLGNPDWKMMAHMPAQGLFVDRKPNNFFQGVWKIPVDEIDRSGSFPSHLTRSVKLLLKVLKEQKDVPKLHSIFIQLSRDPDSGKKYMRDAERVKFARLAHQYCLDAIKGRMPELRRSDNHAKAVKCLMEVYKVYNYISFKMDISQTIEANELLEDTYKAVMGKRVLEDEEVLEQAIRFCQEEVQHHKARQNQPPVGKTNVETTRKDGNQSDFFSPEKSSSLVSKIAVQSQSATNVSQGSKVMEKEKKSLISPFQDNVYKTLSASESSIGKPKPVPGPTGVGMSVVKQTMVKSGPQGLQGKPLTTGGSKVIQKPSIQISTVKTNIPKEKFVGELKSKSLTMSGRGSSGFKPYNPKDSSVPAPVGPPAVPAKKVIEVIEISSSDDESDTKTNPGKAGSQVQPGGTNIGDSSQKTGGNNLRTLLQGGEYQTAPRTASITQGGKGVGLTKGGNLPVQKPYPTGIVYKGGNQIQQLSGNLSKGIPAKPSQKTVGTKENNSSGHPTSHINPGYVMYGAAKVIPSSSHHKPSPSSQESITDDSDLSEKEDKTYQPSEESSSEDDNFDPKTSKTKSGRRLSKSGMQPVMANLQGNQSIQILNAETGQVVDSDSQKSDLVTDPEQLFFDVKDWLDDL